MLRSQTATDAPARQRFTDAVAVVTGSGRGIGFEVARLLLAEGARVVVNDVNPARLDEAVERLGGDETRVRRSLTDVTDPAAVEAMLAETVTAFGEVDVLVNVVGGSYGAVHMRLLEFDLAEWRRVLELNLTSVFLCTKAVVPSMRRKGKGAIVNVSSSAGVRGEPGLWSPPYCAAKAGVQGLTRQVANEYGHAGIRVNCVAQGDVLSERTYEYLHGEEPGYFEDEQEARRRYERFPIPRLGEPVEVANVICFLASDDASYVTGETVLITGGSYLAP
ncbi:MAG TPA: SDR family NAD(P)-dependent oxidoreductase [Actinomycetes bacterium]|nr:SDR family NAD(P)-dependent oxidoreductase [Actinomycetes bacterium]